MARKESPATPAQPESKETAANQAYRDLRGNRVARVLEVEVSLDLPATQEREGRRETRAP